MSTVSKKQQQNQPQNQPQRQSNAPAGKPSAPPQKDGQKQRPPRRIGRHWKVGGILFIVLLVLVALLPTILVHTPLFGIVLRRAARLDGSLSFQSASLGWFSSTTIKGVAIRDTQGEPVLEVDSISCNRPLIKLIFSSANLGTLRIEKPRLTAKCTRDGSNVETVLAHWLAAPASPSSSASGVDLALEVADGEATIADQETQQSWHVNNLQFALDLSRRLAWPARVEASAAIDDRGNAATLSFKSHVKKSDAPPADATAWAGLAGTDGDYSLQLSALPLAMFRRIAARAVPGFSIEGTLDTNMTGQWTGPANVKLEGTATAGNLSLAAAALGSDVLRLERAEASCHVTRQDKQLTIEDTKVECDVGNLSAAGHIDVGDHGITSPADLLAQRDGGIKGTLDLARLARLLPNTLRVRQGTEITSGQINLAVSAANQGADGAANPSAPAWHARLESSQLVAVDRGRQIRWDRPVAIDLDVHQTDQGPAIDNVVCASDFLRVNASGSADKLTADVKLSLKQLTDDLGRFVDLGGLALAGDGDGQLQWTRSATGDFEAGGQINLHNFQCSLPQHQPWSEDGLTVTLGAKGHIDAAATRIDDASVQLRAAAGQVEVRFLQPLSPTNLQLNFQGDMARLQPLLAGSSNLRLGGHLSGTAVVQQSEGAISCKADCDVEQVTVAAPSGQSFQDPRLHCAVQCSYQMADGVLKIDQCELTSGIAGTKVGGQVALSGAGEAQIDGNISYQWEKLNVLLQPYCGTSLQLAGGGASPLSYHGPLDVTRGEANTAIQFGGANAYGFQLGPGELKLHLAGGRLTSEPMQVACNQGTITLQPELRLAGQSPEFRMSSGTLANRIQLDPVMCRSALRYIVPVISSVTQSQGQFSIVLEGCRIPLNDLTRAEIAGRVVVHSAAMSPGAMVQQFTPFLSSPPSLVNIPPETVILFRMTQGRIYHQNMMLDVGGIRFRTYGSVGLDDTVKIMVETSVPLKWLPQNAVTDAIRNQKIQVPLTGTLKAMHFDEGELARAMAQVGGNVTRGLLNSNLGNQLQGLIRPQK